MDMKRTILIVLLAGTAACTKMRHPSPTPDTAAQEKNVSPVKTVSVEEMKQAWESAAKPGDAHKALKPLVGAWSTTAKCWVDPTKPPTVSKGTSETAWVLDGRFVHEQYAGKMDGKPFHGQGLIGFDNVQRTYVSTWADSMNTGLFNQRGEFDDGKKILTLRGAYKDPVSGETVQTRTVTTIASNNQHTFEMYEFNPQSGTEVKTVEISYSRKK